MKKLSAHSQKGAILPLLVVVLLIAGILVTTGLVKVPQIFKPKASGSQNIYFTGPNVSKNEESQFYTDSYNVDVALRSPFGPSIPKPVFTPPPFSSPPPPIPKSPPPYASPFPTPFPSPSATPATSLTCGGIANLSCPKGFDCLDAPGNYPDQSGICVPSKFGFPLPPLSSCSDNPCPDSYACIQMRSHAFCIAKINKSPVEVAQKLSQMKSSLSQDETSLKVDPNLILPSDVNVNCKIEPGNGPIKKVDVNWNVPSNASQVMVYLDDSTKAGWSGLCDKNYPGDVCKIVDSSQNQAELSIDEGKLYNVWVEYKDKNGVLSKPSKKMPIDCRTKPPTNISTLGFRLAESEEELNYASYRPYVGDSNRPFSSDGTVIVNYYFKDPSPGNKTIWVQFLGSDGKVSPPESASIILRGVNSTPAPPACDHPVNCPIPSTLPGQNCTWNNNDNDPCSCPNIVCTSSTPDPNGKPVFTTPSITLDPNNSNIIQVTGINFGNQIGYVYYSRGGSHEVQLHDGVYWTDTLIRIPRQIKDPTSPVPNILVLEQYLKICQSDQNKCSQYVVMPKESRFTSE